MYLLVMKRSKLNESISILIQVKIYEIQVKYLPLEFLINAFIKIKANITIFKFL